MSHEALVPAPAEVSDELERVRERFLSAFDIDTDDSMNVIDRYFDSRGLYRHPVICIPYTKEGYAEAYAIATESSYPLPFVYRRFLNSNNLSVPNRPGTGFSVPAYRLNFVEDTTSAVATAWGG